MKRKSFLAAIAGMYAGSIVSPLFSQQKSKPSKHPFLIVTKDQFPALREKASREPWKSMKADALARSEKGSRDSAYDLQYFTGAAALAYILDEPNSQLHARRVRDAIVHQYPKLTLVDTGDWTKVVPGLGSFFIAILALDIVHDALSEDDIRQCEEAIAGRINTMSPSGTWGDVRRGTHGAWDIYRGARTSPDDDYYNGIMRQITEDGVSPVTNHYAWERVGGGDSRISKSGYMDVLEFTGIDRRYYNNERIQKFQRWLFGSSVNCAKEMAIFGDMLPNQDINNDMLHRRVVNFDMEAAGYAAWFHEGRPAIGHIITYILPKQPLPAPVVPSSKIYANGGAFFRDAEDDPKGLHGVLYNIRSQFEGHTHYETNGLALSALGNRLLVNGGRLGPTVQAAPLNNTLAINGENHASKLGGGLTGGFVSDQLDFASGIAGPALEGSAHTRSLLMLRSTAGTRGYFIVLDEVETQAGNTINMYLHPACQTDIVETAANREYDAPIDLYPTVRGASIAIYYAAAPDKVNIEKVLSAVPRTYPNYPLHCRIEAIYNAGPDGKRSLASILYPYDADNPKAAFAFSQGGGFAKTAIRQSGGVIDYLYESTGETRTQDGAYSMRAAAALIREVDGALDFWFVRKGAFFADGTREFESDEPIDIAMKGGEGAIVSPGAVITIQGGGANALRFEPAPASLETGAGSIRAKLEKGTYYIKTTL